LPEQGPPLDPEVGPGVETRPARPVGWLATFAGLALAFQLVAVYLPGTPDSGLELPWLPGVDKLVHALIFGIPVYLFGLLTRRVGLVAGLFAAHAALSELIQWRFIPYRDGDVWDAVADLIGIGLAVLALKRSPMPWR
jgi:hypothetical protein